MRPFLRALSRWSLCAGFLVGPLFSEGATVAAESQAEEAPSLAALSSLCWKLEESNWDYGMPIPEVLEAAPAQLEKLILTSKRSGGGYNLHRSVEALALKGDTASIQKARTILERLIEIHGGANLDAAVTTHGIEYHGITQRQESGNKVYEAEPPNQQRPKVLNFKDLGYEHAMLYLLTGERKHAAVAKDILLRFSSVVGEWPLYDRENKPHSQDELSYLKKSTANGLWSVWNPLDLAISQPLLRAYDIVRPILTPTEQSAIVEKLFIHQKKLAEQFQEYRAQNGFLYSNLEGYRLAPAIRFGLVLERPEFIHEAVALWRNLLRYSFTADGIWKELTPGYHTQVMTRVATMVPIMLKGYSDPAGYLDAKDGTRFDQLDLESEAAPVFAQMQDGFNVLAMPDGTYASLNDDWPKQKKVPAEFASIQDRPGLLGISGVAKLGAQKTVAFLQFDGTRGHDHLDALNLLWFSGGREVFSDTGYQALPGSDSTREWHSMSASHNTVVVDEKSHFNNRERYTVPKATDSPLGPSHSFNAILPGAARVANQGRLLFWNASHERVQAMEAEQERAYPGITSLFRRTVVLIPEGNGDSTLVDIFRVRGGTKHDFMLRGGLDAPYSLTFNIPLKPEEKTVHSYIEVKEAGEVRAPLLATARYEDGYAVRSHLGGVFGSPHARLELMVGEAPAIRRLGKAPFSLLRNRFEGAGANLESCFVWIHEGGREARISNVKVESAGGVVKVVIERPDRTDWVFSSEEDAALFEAGPWKFQGRLAYASKAAEETFGFVFSGEELVFDGKTVAPARRFLSGTVLETTRRENGAATDSVLIKLDQTSAPVSKQPSLVHIDFGPHARFSIPAIGIGVEEEGHRLLLAHSPGFDVTENGAFMSQYPGWGYSSPATILLETEPQGSTK